MEKLTNNDKIEIVKMRRDGYYLKEIAHKYGVTKQCVSDICLRADGRNTEEFEGKFPRKNTAAKESCIYPNISKFLDETHHTYRSMAKSMGVPYHKLYSVLSGECEARKTMIDCVLKFTKLSYDVAFATMQDV